MIISKLNIFTLFLSGLLLMPFLVYAQDLTMPDKFENLRLTGENAVGNTVRTYDGRYEGVRGHPYFLEEWTPGNVLLENEREYRNVKLKYNVYQDQLIGLQHDKFAIMLPKDQVRAFTMLKQDSSQTANFVKARHLEVDLSKVPPEQYVQVLYEGKLKLYAVNRKLLDEADYRGAYNTGRRYDLFGELDAVFYLSGPWGTSKLKRRNKKVLKAFKMHTKILKDYVELEELDLRQREDLIQLLQYYESL